MMHDDLISRRDAIDALDKILPVDPMRNEYTQGITCGVALAIEYIKQLPSVQPDAPDTNVGDMISRQAAKQELYKMLHDCFWADGEEQDAVAMVLDNLSSAQSEERTEERTETHACDCISRQAAIDAVSRGCRERSAASVALGLQHRISV